MTGKRDTRTVRFSLKHSSRSRASRAPVTRPPTGSISGIPRDVASLIDCIAKPSPSRASGFIHSSATSADISATNRLETPSFIEPSRATLQKLVWNRQVSDPVSGLGRCAGSLESLSESMRAIRRLSIREPVGIHIVEREMYMNRLVLRVLAVKAVAMIAVFAAPAYADGGLHRFVVFGDSLSDPGNYFIEYGQV